MKNKILLFAVIILSFASCSKDDTSDCIKNALKDYEMKLYFGQGINCEFFLELYEYEGESFFQVGSHCADIFPNPVNCEGEPICENGAGPDCAAYFAEAEFIRIVGIRE